MTVKEVIELLNNPDLSEKQREKLLNLEAMTRVACFDLGSPEIQYKNYDRAQAMRDAANESNHYQHVRDQSNHGKYIYK